MAIKKATYVEPESYFTPSMLKVAKEYDKKKAAEQKNAKKSTKGKK